MKKVLKVTGKILLGILILFAAFLTVMLVYNHIMMKKDKPLLDERIGQAVEVDGHSMNIYTEGSGDHTIVFMSGWGTPSPVYDFKPLYERLSDEYRIAVIEKFGYGFSDVVDGERSFDTILSQDREALEKAGISGPYVLCAHSLSGLEATLWAQKYPDEVEAVVGLDMSVANYPGFAELKDSFLQKAVIKLNRAAAFTGLDRILIPLDPPEYCENDHELKQLTAIACEKLANKTVEAENDAIGEVCDEINADSLPTAPTLQYLSGDNKENADWKTSHQAFADASINGSIVQLDCGHYVHNYEYERIAKEMKEFINGLDR